MDARALDELVTANRILAREGIVDAFGHVSVRPADQPDRFWLSRARAPECIEAEDLMQFALDGTPLDAAGRQPYAERFIHAAIYEARLDVRAVVHNHSAAVIPFGATGVRLRPIMHMCASMGTEVPVWDSRTSFGDTNLLVTNLAMARDLAAALGSRSVALMRGHGCVVAGASLREVVFNAIYLELNAALQQRALALGEVTFLSDGEVRAVLATRSSFTFERAWEFWCHRAGRPYDERAMEGPLARA
ncbi:MAG TPA: class II aldolase/adducin family protein [Vicinamibacterales bacterium]|nr:class II aldolase/adducin family protein [Vicinamibacterales bacterium]